GPRAGRRPAARPAGAVRAADDRRPDRRHPGRLPATRLCRGAGRAGLNAHTLCASCLWPLGATRAIPLPTPFRESCPAMSARTDFSDAISSPDEIIADARNGRMFILVDHEHRENEGDLVIPAQMCTPSAINFMATHGRGLICLALPGRRIAAPRLPLMSPKNSSRHETAFTLSIEAREGVTTGISAADRARTVSTAIDPTKGAADIASPG